MTTSQNQLAAMTSAEPPATTTLPDLLEGGLRVVFCGTASSAASAKASAYYAGPGNKFWPTLHATGLTPRRLEPVEYPEVLSYGIGLTDLCKSRSGSDRQIGRDAFDVERLEWQMATYRPAWIAFNGKAAAKEALGMKSVELGRSDRRVGGVPAYVLPSTSGAASGHWDIERWHALARLVGGPG